MQNTGLVMQWWPFQLAFQLLNVSAIEDVSHGDRQVCDLLWFPTGGGKTEAYLGLAGVFDLQPGEAMLVATHQHDLAGAKACGLATAFVERPLEMGPGGGKDDARDPRFDLHSTDFLDLAEQLGC